MKRTLDRAIVDTLKYSNGVGMQFLTIYGISNRNIADIIKYNDHLDQENESGKFIYFSGSGPLAFSYEVATKKVYYEDFEEIGPVRTLLYDCLDDFFQQIAEKVEYIYENQLNDKIYTLKDENIPNVIRIT